MEENDFNLGDELKIKYNIETVHLTTVLGILDDDDGYTHSQTSSPNFHV